MAENQDSLGNTGVTGLNNSVLGSRERQATTPAFTPIDTTDPYSPYYEPQDYIVATCTGPSEIEEDSSLRQSTPTRQQFEDISALGVGGAGLDTNPTCVDWFVDPSPRTNSFGDTYIPDPSMLEAINDIYS